ncbi:hypothetical protein M1247_25900 [Mycobacterium sp. 21AC1]|uniref:hypothetical protein n=1 Tax=[Mycobacterium] appelbergii TaxID=2939269 RepID=UPI0029394759|nr:hypothetical protein [Mycobacterium sp. 21AC1]MDV3128371.1 hypothetical protein [Mycobacterium sp. 21AC1]
MVILDKEGKYKGGWGDAATYPRPHGAAFCADGDLLLVDAGSHVVVKAHRNGEQVLTIGRHGVAAPLYSGQPFNQPTDAFEDPLSRDIFVADGYGNSSIHRFDASGEHIASWGEPGSGDAQLSNPHGMCLLDDDHLAVCDRENYRILIFDLAGKLVDRWHWHHPSAIRVVGDLLYIAELGPPAYLHGKIPNMGCTVSVCTRTGKVLERLGAELPGLGTGHFLAPHSLAIDEAGTVYVAEANAAYLSLLGTPAARAESLACLRRWSAA